MSKEIPLEDVRETEKLRIFKRSEGRKTTYFRIHKEDESEELVEMYSVEGKTYTFPFDGPSIKTVIFEGFNDTPPLISSYGYGFDHRSFQSFVKNKFEDDRIDTLLIKKKGKSKKDGKTLILRLDELQALHTMMGQEQKAANDTKTSLIKNFFVSVFPEVNFDYTQTNSNKGVVLRNLNDRFLSQLTADDVSKIGDFYVQAAKKFSRADIVKKLTIGLQKNAQLVALNDIVQRYEKLLKDDPAERVWQGFFDEYITLFDTRYAHKINYKNIATGITKYPDLVLVDIYGYIDFYELKKSSTPLLKYDDSHKTWYWTKEVSMVIAQASDYLQKAKENALSYAATIKNETATEHQDGVDVNIINPRAIIVAGSTKELNTAKKRHHFKTLRESLKDIEFVLYDELLDRLKNLLDSIKT